MRKIYLFIFVTLVGVIVAIATHYLADQSQVCPPIGVVTRVVVSPDRIITDQEQIRQLTAFANARRKCSQPSTYTMPAPRITATFYKETDFLSAIGVGSNFIFVACPNWRGIRSATDDEINEFKRLIDDTK